MLVIAKIFHSLQKGIRAGFKGHLTGHTRVLASESISSETMTDAAVGDRKVASEIENLPYRVTIIFVLGGPGSGKGTQCSLAAKHFGFTHLSAGNLLEAEGLSGSKYGSMIQSFKKEGKIVPSEVTVKLLDQAMQKSMNKKFLIDGFPRNEENRSAFENMIKIEPECILYLDCSEEEMTRRLLKRNQGRADDNPETIRKRLQVHSESTMPVIAYYSSIGKVQKIDAGRTIEEIFEDVKRVISKYATTTTYPNVS